MIDDRRQFGVLYRNFLFRVIDPELLSASGNAQNLLVQLTALLAAYSFVIALFTAPPFALSTEPLSKLVVRVWGVEEFLISTTLTVSGLFAVLAWHAMIPDRRDSYVLNPLPLRTRTIFAAKVAATATALGISIVAVNFFTGLSLPFLLVAEGSDVGGALRSLLAYWTTMAAAGAFIFASIFALQNAAAAVFSYQFFQRISALLQLFTFFLILALFFLTPPLATPLGLSSQANQHLLAWVPSFWFLGLFHELNGTTFAAFASLADRAIWSLVGVSLFTLAMAAISYRRTIQRVVEQPGIAPGNYQGYLSKLVSAVTRRIFADPLERAILLFSARTLARSKQHRLILSFYIGTGFAISLAYAKGAFYGAADHHWNRPAAPLLLTSLVLLFFSIVGTRAAFALPIALPANWIFRMSAVRSPASYFAAVRKTLLVLAAAPALLGSAIVYFSIWPGRPALEHLMVLVLVSIFLIQTLLRRFRKIPFTCSYLPGKSELRLKLGIAGFLFLFAVETGANVEQWSMQKPARYAIVLACLITAAIWATRRTAVFAGSVHNRLQFEDMAAAEIYALDLRRDSDYVNEGDYLDVVSSPPSRPFGARIRLYAFGLLLLLATGFSYERFGEWRDRIRFPQEGRLVNIGGRSLNLYCSGSGSPTVVMESGAGLPGYSWKLVQIGVSKLTRACWYDRAGYGWSDPAPRPRTAADIVEDLHKLLHTAGVRPPYLLVGHSLGGFYVRVFAARYGGEVAGLVLVDSADEYEDSSRLPKSMQSTVSWFPTWLRITMAPCMRLGSHAGMARLLDNGVSAPDGRLSLDDTSLIHTLQLQPKAFDASLNEGLSRSETLVQVKAVRSLGSIPLLVLSGAKKPLVNLDSENEAALLDRFMKNRVYVTQARLATLATRGRQIVLENYGHGIPSEAPEEVVGAVRDLLGAR